MQSRSKTENVNEIHLIWNKTDNPIDFRIEWNDQNIRWFHVQMFGLDLLFIFRCAEKKRRRPDEVSSHNLLVLVKNWIFSSEYFHLLSVSYNEKRCTPSMTALNRDNHSVCHQSQNERRQKEKFKIEINENHYDRLFFRKKTFRSSSFKTLDQNYLFFRWFQSIKCEILLKRRCVHELHACHSDTVSLIFFFFLTGDRYSFWNWRIHWRVTTSDQRKRSIE